MRVTLKVKMSSSTATCLEPNRSVRMWHTALHLYFKSTVAWHQCCSCRERTKLVYSMYSRMSGETVKRNLMKLGVDYFVLEDSWCTRRTRYSNSTIRLGISVYIFVLTSLCSSGLGAACRKSGTLRIPKMSVNFPSAPKCPGTHAHTSPQSFQMTFTKCSKSLKLPKISDNIIGWTDQAPLLFFTFLI